MTNTKNGPKAIQPKSGNAPLQLRWPSSDVKSAKMMAIELDYKSVSAFMLDAFHAFVKSRK
jgi:hypothetical protein